MSLASARRAFLRAPEASYRTCPLGNRQLKKNYSFIFFARRDFLRALEARYRSCPLGNRQLVYIGLLLGLIPRLCATR
jgi:hypothetical protein